MDKKNILESLLFVSGHPLSYKKLVEILSSEGVEISESDVENSLKELAKDYEENDRGLRLVFFLYDS